MSSELPSHRILDDLWPEHRELRQSIPGVYRAFDQLSTTVMADGALSVKHKELIALAIGVVQGCDGCLAANAKGAVHAGATREEAAEAIGVAVMMQGGPATVYGARAFDAFCEFETAVTRE